MKNLAAKLVKVLASVESVGKTGWNDHQKYSYTTEEDVLAAVKKALIENKIFITQSSKITDVKELTNDKGKKSFITCVETINTFIDAESGESLSVNSVGQGHDSMDKGVFKALTGANKYFLMKNLMISTGDDPEATGTSKATKSAPVEDDFDAPVATAPVKSAPQAVSAPQGAPSFLTANKAAPAAVDKPIPKGIAAQGKVVNMSSPEPEF